MLWLTGERNQIRRLFHLIVEHDHVTKVAIEPNYQLLAVAREAHLADLFTRYERKFGLFSPRTQLPYLRAAGGVFGRQDRVRSKGSPGITRPKVKGNSAKFLEIGEGIGFGDHVEFTGRGADHSPAIKDTVMDISDRALFYQLLRLATIDGNTHPLRLDLF